MHLDLIAALQHGARRLDATVGKTLAPIHESARLLTTMPGVSDLTAQVMVAEIGVDMTRFPHRGPSGLLDRALSAQRRECRQTPLHPRTQGRPVAQDRARHRRLGGGTRQRLLLQAQFHRLRSRRGAKKAILAVAASMLTAAYHMLKNGVEYKDLGAATSLAATAPRQSSASCAGSTISAAPFNSHLKLPESCIRASY